MSAPKPKRVDGPGIARAASRVGALTDTEWRALATTNTVTDLMAATGLSRHTVYTRNKGVGVTTQGGRNALAVPDGFAEAELGVTLGVLATRYGVCVDTVRRWSAKVAETTGQPARQRFVARQRATYLAKHTAENFYVAARSLHVATTLVAKWAVEAGVASPKAIRMRERALKVAAAKGSSSKGEPPGRATWFGGEETRLPRELWARAVRPWCPEWENECDEQPA